MAKFEKTQTVVTLDSETKRILKNLTKAVDRLARVKNYTLDATSSVKRLSEPVEAVSEEREGAHTAELGGETVELLREVSGKSVHLGKYNALR